MLPINIDKIVKHLPRGAKPELYEAISRQDVLKQYGLDTVEKQAHFWAQMAHETGGFRWPEELGGREYFRRYDGRKDLGNTQPGDGYRFKGRGFIHLTGRHNYKKFGDRIGEDLVNNPEKAAEPEIALKIALEYWKDRGLNDLAEKGDIVGITRRINGGLNGLQDRRRYYDVFRDIFAGS